MGEFVGGEILRTEDFPLYTMFPGGVSPSITGAAWSTRHNPQITQISLLPGRPLSWVMDTRSLQPSV
jgi:hypothetical protein